MRWDLLFSRKFTLTPLPRAPLSHAATISSSTTISASLPSVAARLTSPPSSSSHRGLHRPPSHRRLLHPHPPHAQLVAARPHVINCAPCLSPSSPPTPTPSLTTTKTRTHRRRHQSSLPLPPLVRRRRGLSRRRGASTVGCLCWRGSIGMALIAPPSSSVAALRRHPVQFLRGSDVSKETKGSISYSFVANSRNANMKSAGWRIAASLKKNSGFPADMYSENDDMLLRKSTSVQGQDHPTTDSVLSADSIVAAEIISADLSHVVDMFSNNDDDTELDLDSPTEGFASISEAIEDIRQGKLVIVVDDESRENEGDLILAASLVTPEAMAFIVRYSTGIVCVSMKEEDLERLNLPLMVSTKENEEKLCTAFTITVDAKEGTTTGVSAKDRAKTVMTLASPHSKPEDFNRPGHIFPLKYREGGVLKRAGHTEASVDLAMLAGLPPVGVLCEIVDEDGSMARLPKLRVFAERENLKIVSIADLIRYRRKRDRLIERASVARLPLRWGNVRAYCYRSVIDGIEHIAMVKGEIGDGQDILVRVHSECLTGDIFGSARCDCGDQLAMSMEMIEKAGRGVLVYLRGHEGRGIGLGHKLRAYNLQDDGRDTVEANEELGLPVDSREYGIGAQILRDLGVRSMKLMTNNPAKYVGLKGYGLSIVGRIPLVTPITTENRRYLETKRTKMGHVYGSVNGQVNHRTELNSTDEKH